ATLLVPGETAVAPRPAARRRGGGGDWEEDDGPEEVAGPSRTSGKAVWSVILGAASMLCWVLTSIPAVILGILSLRDIGRSRGRVRGQGLAIAGIVLGAVGTLGFIPIVAILIGLLVPAVQKVREAAARIQSANNLRQIGIAMHNYNDTYGHLPTQAIYGKDGKPLLSWRVAILPFIEQEALYRQFHLDEPWDSAHNKALLVKMPKTYALPGREGTTTTFYQAFVGPGAFFEDRKELRIPADFRDGTSNTILCVTAADAVPWTKPEDLPFDPARPLPKLGGHFSNGFNVLLCDASVRFLSNKVSETTLKAAITRDGGEILGPDW
ncbi:MAG TPA: DUF1559 domain-containing protein, partial [Gemmataceae bacterium]|nr:DUF1559 domain-containing protein [Gemmataceae bacterium]